MLGAKITPPDKTGRQRAKLDKTFDALDKITYNFLWRAYMPIHMLTGVIDGIVTGDPRRGIFPDLAAPPYDGVPALARRYQEAPRPFIERCCGRTLVSSLAALSLSSFFGGWIRRHQGL